MSLERKNPYALKNNEYDPYGRPITGDVFYRKYVSKSLPCVFRREIADDEGVIELSKATSREEIDEMMSKKIGHVKSLVFTKLDRIKRKS